jgi:hypothetical protein
LTKNLNLGIINRYNDSVSIFPNTRNGKLAAKRGRKVMGLRG